MTDRFSRCRSRSISRSPSHGRGFNRAYREPDRGHRYRTLSPSPDRRLRLTPYRFSPRPRSRSRSPLYRGYRDSTYDDGWRGNRYGGQRYSERSRRPLPDQATYYKESVKSKRVSPKPSQVQKASSTSANDSITNNMAVADPNKAQDAAITVSTRTPPAFNFEPTDEEYEVIIALQKAVQSLLSAKIGRPVKLVKGRVNHLVKTYRADTPTCNVCSLPGHQQRDVKNASLCHHLIMSTIGWWEDVGNNLAALAHADSHHYDEFFKWVQENCTANEGMARGKYEIVPSSSLDVVMQHLTAHWLRFEDWWAGLGLKRNEILGEEDETRYWDIHVPLCTWLLGGKTYAQVINPNSKETLEELW